MFKKSVKLALFFALIGNLTGYSQEVLSLEDCRALAIENNKKLKIATEQERLAYYEKKEAFLQYFPKVSFAGTYLRNEKNLNLIPSSITIPNIPGLPLPIPPGTEIPTPEALRGIGEVDIKNIWAGGFSLTQPLFTGGKLIAYNDIRKYAEELAKSQKYTQLQEVILESDNAYWQVASLANKMKLAKSYVNLLAKMDSDVKSMEEEGVATKADGLSVRVKLNEAEMVLTKVENGLSLAKMLLCQICGLEISGNISLKDEFVSEITSAEEVIIPDINNALANRTEIKSLELAGKIYEKKEKIAFSEFLPTMAFTANYLWTNPSFFDGPEKKLKGMWNVGVVLKVPLNVFSSSAKLNAAKVETQIHKYQLEEAKEKIELQINQSSFKLTEAYKKLISANKNMEKANENLRYANVGFEEGVIPASDVLAAHTAWVSANSELIDAQIDIKLCKIYLDKAVGKSLQ